MPLLHIYTNPLRGIWKLEESSENLLQFLTLTDAYLPFLSQIKSERRKQEWLAARVLLKEMLGKEMLIKYHPNGSPFLPGSLLQISISHTKGYVALILQENSCIGIDIERRDNRILSLGKRFLSQYELTQIDSEKKADHLLIYWCAKETLYKMIGLQGVDFQEHLHVHPFLPENSGELLVQETYTSQRQFFKLAYSFTSEYIMVWSILPVSKDKI